MGLSTIESGTANVNVKVVHPFLSHGAIFRAQERWRHAKEKDRQLLRSRFPFPTQLCLGPMSRLCERTDLTSKMSSAFIDFDIIKRFLIIQQKKPAHSYGLYHFPIFERITPIILDTNNCKSEKLTRLMYRSKYHLCP